MASGSIGLYNKFVFNRLGEFEVGKKICLSLEICDLIGLLQNFNKTLRKLSVL